MKIIECIIKIKEERRSHYEQLAKSATDKELERLAMLLADANTQLLKKLKKLKESPEAVSLNEAGLSEKVCVFSPSFDAKHPEVALSRDSDAYRHVVKEIEEAVEFYEQLGAEAELKEVKTLSLKLAELEREHLSVVTNIYAFVEDPRTFLEWGEFSNLKPL